MKERVSTWLGSVSRSRVAVPAASVVVAVVAISAVGILLLGPVDVALVLLGLVQALLMLLLLGQNASRAKRNAAAQRRIEAKLVTIEKLVSRAEWRNGEAMREVSTVLRMRLGGAQPSGNQEGATLGKGADPLMGWRGDLYRQRQMERFLTQLLARAREEGY